MIKSNRFFAFCLCTGLISAYLPQSFADQYTDRADNAAVLEAIQSQAPCSYGQKVNEKALRTAANFEASFVEIPKSIVNNTDDSNIIFGVIGGLIEGSLNIAGRVGTGIADLLTLPVPTKPVAYPVYPWDEIDQDTHYSELFRMDNCPPDSDTVIATPDPSALKAAPAVVVPPRQALSNYEDNTNRKLDVIFKKEMMK